EGARRQAGQAGKDDNVLRPTAPADPGDQGDVGHQAVHGAEHGRAQPAARDVTMLVTGHLAVGAAGSGHWIIPWLVRAPWEQIRGGRGRQLGAAAESADSGNPPPAAHYSRCGRRYSGTRMTLDRIGPVTGRPGLTTAASARISSSCSTIPAFSHSGGP